MLWEASAPVVREPAFDEQQTTYKLSKIPRTDAAPAAPAAPLTLDALLGDAPRVSSPATPSSTPVQTGAQNPWSTDVLRRDVDAVAPVPTGAQNPWSTDVLRRDVPVAHVANAPSATVAPRTEVASPEQIRAVQAMASRAAASTAPRRSRVGAVVAVVAGLLLVGVGVALFFR